MQEKGVLTKILAGAGTGLVWLPILAPFVFSTIRLIAIGRFNFDYLMPGELFPLVLLGGGLLVWAALRARSRRGLIGWGLVSAVFLLIASQAYAVVSGLASGEAEAAGLRWFVLLGVFGAFLLALVVLAVGGILLLRDLYRPVRPPVEGSAA